MEDGEGIVFVNPPKNKFLQMHPEGCLRALLGLVTLGIINFFKPRRSWQCNFVLTDKRIVTIPTPPNRKKWPVESFYYKDIKAAKEKKKQDESATADFSITTKPDGEMVDYTIMMAMSMGNLFKAFTSYQTQQGAKARAANMDFSDLGHVQLRNYLVDTINDCAAAVNG